MQILKVNFETSNPLRQFIEAIPSIVLIVDADLRVLDSNSAAEAIFGVQRRQSWHQRCGEVLHCVHAEDVYEGCSGGEFCRSCLVRESVSAALAGEKSVRKRMRLELMAGKKARAMEILLTASPLNYEGSTNVMLILEDISEIVELQKMRPHCVSCDKVKSESADWLKLEHYIRQNLNGMFAQSLCPDCFKTEMSVVERSMGMLPPP